MRIAYFLNSVALGGMESHSLALAAAIRGRRAPDGSAFEPVVILPDDPSLDLAADGFRAANIETHRLTLAGEQRPLQRWATFWRLRSLLRSREVAIMHQQRTGPYHGKWALLAARLAGVPVIVATEHQAPDARPSPATRLANDFADRLLARLIAVSESDRQQQLTIGGRRPELLITIPNGVDLDRLRPSSPEVLAARAGELGIPPGAPVIGTVGRLHEQKDVATFLLAASLLRERFPELQALVVGDGPLAAALRRQATGLGLGDAMHFTGHRDDVADLISLMDVFVLASIYESFGLVLAEAMALCRPIVATCVGGIPEVVSDGVTGLLVPPQQPEALAAAIERCLADPALATRLAAAGRERVVREFTVDVMVRRTMSVYEDALAGRGRR
jgi:glycosyltransferase involved in cell wall biosynthesis